jgi:hypothetical protein
VLPKHHLVATRLGWVKAPKQEGVARFNRAWLATATFPNTPFNFLTLDVAAILIYLKNFKTDNLRNGEVKKYRVVPSDTFCHLSNPALITCGCKCSHPHQQHVSTYMPQMGRPRAGPVCCLSYYSSTMIYVYIVHFSVVILEFGSLTQAQN